MRREIATSQPIPRTGVLPSWFSFERCGRHGCLIVPPAAHLPAARFAIRQSYWRRRSSRQPDGDVFNVGQN